jgi:hypothetical protein
MENAGNPAGKSIGWKIYFAISHWLPTKLRIRAPQQIEIVRVVEKKKYFVFLLNPNSYEPQLKHVTAQTVHKVPELLDWHILAINGYTTSLAFLPYIHRELNHREPHGRLNYKDTKPYMSAFL